MRNRILYILCSLIPVLSMGQESKSNASAFGFVLHSHGMGLVYQHSFPGENHDWVLHSTLTSFRLFKEQKIESLYKDAGGKNYVLNKLNYAYHISPTFGLAKTLIKRSDFNQVEVKGIVAAGPSMALLKPYYLEVLTLSGPNPIRETVKYDPSRHSYGNIVGLGEYFRGFNELKVQAGASLKAMLNLDFSGSEEYIRALQAGIQVDYFFNKLPLLGVGENRNFFVGASIALLVGNRK